MTVPCPGALSMGAASWSVHIPSKETAEPTWLWDQPAVIPGKILLLRTL